MKEKLADDLMVGTKAIAEYLGISQRKVFYWAENECIPVFKIGSTWAGRKSEIDKHLSNEER